MQSVNNPHALHFSFFDSATSDIPPTLPTNH